MAAWGALFISRHLISPNRKNCKIGPEKPKGECPITSNVQRPNFDLSFVMLGDVFFLNVVCPSVLSLNDLKVLKNTQNKSSERHLNTRKNYTLVNFYNPGPCSH